MQTWQSGQKVAHPPAQAEEVGPGDVDSYGVAESVAEVDAPVEDSSGCAPLTVAEEVGDETDPDGAAS